jgi:aconitate hydratase
VRREFFEQEYAEVFAGDERWAALPAPTGSRFDWDPDSTYIRRPPFFEDLPREPLPLSDIREARVLLYVGDSVTTDHVSPAGAIASDSPASEYLGEREVPRSSFNTYGARRGNHEVMLRGTFGNIRMRNQLAPGTEGGFTRIQPDGPVTTIFEAAQHYQREGLPLIVLGGKEYGTGSSRDWAAKGTALLGVRAVIVESFERIHRSNLLGMGVLPLQFLPGEGPASHGLDGSECYDIEGLDAIQPGKELTVGVRPETGAARELRVRVRIDTPDELEYYRNGGILRYVLRRLLDA